MFVQLSFIISLLPSQNYVVVSHIFYFHLYLGKPSILMIIFFKWVGKNHQLENLGLNFPVPINKPNEHNDALDAGASMLRYKVTVVVSYLPYPVVAGFLGSIGTNNSAGWSGGGVGDSTKVGPYKLYNGVTYDPTYSPLIGGCNPQLPIYKAIFVVCNSIYNY